MTEFDLGYCIGIIVGEGCFQNDHGLRLDVKMAATNPEPMQCLLANFGGALYGPYENQKRCFYIWRVRGRELDRLIVICLARMPDCRKRRQLVELIRRTKWTEQMSLPLAA